MAFQPPQGISAAAVTNIPKEWSKEWFRGFIRNHLEQMDVRNAVAGPGITISTAAAEQSHKLLARGKISSGGVPLTSLASQPAFTVVANDTAATAPPTAINETQLTSMVQIFSSALSGAVPATGAAGTTRFLREDGVWHTAVQSVALADGSAVPIFAVTGSPVTTSGTLTETLVTQIANTVFAGPTTGAAAQPTFRALVAADIPSSALPGGFTGFANPSAKVALVAVNGSATTAMRSDAAPALDVSISPTWTGVHIFSGTAAAPVQVSSTVPGLVTLNSTDAKGAYLTWKRSGTALSDFGNSAQVFIGGTLDNIGLGTRAAYGLDLGTNGVVRLTINSSGNVTISAPSSGTGLTNSGSAVFGSPTGGDEGTGTLNATGLYVNGTAVSTAVAANPTASVGLSAVNGSATTFMRSDAAPALSQAIVPTWTGATHTFNPSGIATIVLSDATGKATAIKLLGSSAAQGKNWLIGNQNNLSDTLEFTPSTANGGTTFTTPALKITGSGNVSITAPASGDTLTVTNVAGANALVVTGNAAGTAVLRLNTQATTGAQTATFTATNKPGVATTSPDKWIPINLDGTTHYVPAFL